MLNNHLIAKTRPVSIKDNIIYFNNYRITVLGKRLFRIEKNDFKIFNDKPTQSIWFRDFNKQDFNYIIKKEYIKVTVAELSIYININFEKSYIYIDNKKIKLNNNKNLLGTYFSLDRTSGNKHVDGNIPIKLNYGVVSKNGVAVLDDSDSLIYNEIGELELKQYEGIDLYIFAHGHDYRQAVKDLYALSGEVPMIPKFALGNWWSRYHDYSEKEYIKLINTFEEKNIPMTVATVDMDWHYSINLDIQKKITELNKNNILHGGNSGWYGYSWNKDLFPDYKRFLKELKSKKVKITLNLHPGIVRWFDDMYQDMAKAVNINPETQEKIEMNLSDSNYVNNYFDILHHPYEKNGVDFWWIDHAEKRKKNSKTDNLWLLNHLHYLDNKLHNKYPLILSRYIGVGSHRYPLGFSGDTFMTWDTLKYIPYFTATASNAGYTWWSHDIGGHQYGYKDDELYLRFLQFAVFNPINRLHSNNNYVLTKEPWAYENGISFLAIEQLRLRHKMIPFLYSCNYRTHKNGLALIEPLYYYYSEEKNAYKFRNEYIFGGQLLVVPITKKAGIEKMVSVNVWLPEGEWTDIFTGDVYKGGGVIDMVRSLDSIPVLAKAGGIFILNNEDKGNSIENPKKLEVQLYKGNGSFELYEDNETEEMFTYFKLKSTNNQLICDVNCSGSDGVIPKDRQINFKIFNCKIKKIIILCNNKLINSCFNEEENMITLSHFDCKKTYSIIIDYDNEILMQYIKKRSKTILTKMQGDNNLRFNLYKNILKTENINEYKKLIIESSISNIYKKRLLEYQSVKNGVTL